MNNYKIVTESGKERFTSLFEQSGGIFNAQGNCEAGLVPSTSRPGYRSLHLFIKEGSNAEGKHYAIANAEDLAGINIPKDMIQLLRKGLQGGSQSVGGNRVKQDMLYEVVDSGSSGRSVTYGIFKLPQGWRSRGALQLFRRENNRKAQGGSHLHDYFSVRNIIEDGELPRTMRKQLRQYA